MRLSNRQSKFVLSMLVAAALASACTDEAMDPNGDVDCSGGTKSGSSGSTPNSGAAGAEPPNHGGTQNTAGGASSGGDSGDGGEPTFGGMDAAGAGGGGRGGTGSATGGGGGKTSGGAAGGGGKGGGASGGGGAKASGGAAGGVGKGGSGGTGASGGGGAQAGGTAGTTSGGTSSVCGNGAKEPGEECDDGNLVEGDGCNVICKDSRACEACVAEKCPVLSVSGFPQLSTLRDRCFNDSTPATAGPATGTPRNKLCRDALICIRKNGAAAVWESTCSFTAPGMKDNGSCTADESGYCGLATGPSCDEKPEGPCVKEYEAAAEPPSSSGIPAWVQASRRATTYPLGRALALANGCEAGYCQEECGLVFNCFGAPTPGAVCPGTPSTGGTGGSGATGGAGGKSTGGTSTGGTSGGSNSTGGTSTGGTAGETSTGGNSTGGSSTGGNSAGGTSTGGSGGSSSCATQYDCATLTGSFQDVPRRQLCEDAFACMKSASCAMHDSARSCYCNSLLGTCGNAEFSPCVAPLNAAAESTDVTVVETRMSDSAYAAGVAVKRVTCESP